MKQLPDIVLRAEAYKDNVTTPATLFLTYPTSDSEPVTCGVLFDNQEGVSQVMIEDPHRIHKLQIRGSSFHDMIWIPRMRVENTYRDHIDYSIRGIAELLVEGNLDEFHGSPGTMKCHVLLQDNALLSFYDEGHLIEWLTPFGEAKFVHNYRYGGYVRDMSERKPSKHDIIEVELNPTQHNSLYDLVTELSDYLDDLMWLISFLCKKYVHWYQFDMYYEPQGDVQDKFRLISAFREPVGVKWNPIVTELPGFENHPAELLIKLQILRTSVAQNVFRTYIESEHKSIIRSLIVTIMITYSDAVVEQDLGIIYVALEMLVDTFTDQSILGKSQFHKLQSALKEFIATQDEIELGVAILSF